MEQEVLKKICNDKDCKHGDNPQPIENFGIKKSTKDGRNSKCRVCITRWAAIYSERKGGLKESKITRKGNEKKNEAVTWDTTDHPTDFLRMMRPMYSYLINSPVKQDGMIRLGKTLGELIMFFDVPQRATMEALLYYLERKQEGYAWKSKPKGFQEFADKVEEMLPNGMIKKEPHNSIVYEQLKIFSERLQAMENKMELLYNYWIDGKEKE